MTRNSFESRYPSSSHTSFDISRYQSTSCEDQTSSFEIIDLDNQRCSGSSAERDDRARNIDLRKSSIELVDVDTFQRAALPDRKSSLETHFDFEIPSPRTSTSRVPRQSFDSTNNKRHPHIGVKSHALRRSPLLFQTSSNYSSRDSYGNNTHTKSIESISIQ